MEKEQEEITMNESQPFSHLKKYIDAVKADAGYGAPIPKYNHAEAFKHMKYQSDDKRITIIVWNSRDGVTPFCFPLPGTEIMLQHTDWRNDIYAPNYKPKPGDFIFRDYTQAEAEASAKARCDFARKHGFGEDGIEDLYNEALADIIDNRQPKLEIIK